MKFSVFALLISASLFFVSCSKDDAPVSSPTDGLFKIAEGYATGSGLKAGIYAKSQMVYTGYSKFFILLSDSATGSVVKNAQVELSPMMDMGSMMHSTPFENPSSATAVNSLFPCSVVFIMPSTGGSWSVDVTVTNPANGHTGTFSTSLTVTDPVESRLKSFTSLHDGQKFFVALIEPSAPKVGINDFEIAIYKRASMMSFPADSSLSVAITPEMPTMGHGSPNNINPAHLGNGHYKGKVNFTMTGYWKVNIDYLSGTTMADSTQFFDITF
ncbi:MAG: hypothetical protein EOO01_01525 [Chitinophagaceae bacterium]|nr:MAG: hypothetical protein EOO01_01525 [Chitinophagaceae bacterium]